MPIFAMLLVAAPSLPACRADQLRVTLDARDGEFDGMSHSGTELSIRNVGADCVIVALPTIGLRDARNRLLPFARRAPRGMHPGPVMLPVRLSAGQRAMSDIRWISGPVFANSRGMRVAKLTVTIGSGTLAAPLAAMLYRETGQPATFEQTPLRASDGVATG